MSENQQTTRVEVKKRIALTLASQGVKEALKDVQIEELELSARSYNGLKQSDIHTVGDLARFSKAELANLPNLGKKSLDEIVEVLAWRGIFVPADPRERARVQATRN